MVLPVRAVAERVAPKQQEVLPVPQTVATSAAQDPLVKVVPEGLVQFLAAVAEAAAGLEVEAVEQILTPVAPMAAVAEEALLTPIHSHKMFLTSKGLEAGTALSCLATAWFQK
jgi:uncharacterized hydantoinase/oxoprolinase family protein